MLCIVMADWYYGKDNTQHGPVSEQEIHALVSSGQINSSSIIWREGMTDWIPLKDVPEFQSISASAGDSAAPYASPQTNSPQSVQHMPVIAAPTSGLSIAALVCGILGCITCYIGGFFGLPAVICGHMSLKKIKNSPTPIGGKGMAIAGLICGYIGIAMTLFFLIFLAIGIAGGAMSSTVTP